MRKSEEKFELKVQRGKQVYKGTLEKIDFRLKSKHFYVGCNGARRDKYVIGLNGKDMDGMIQRLLVTLARGTASIRFDIDCINDRHTIIQKLPAYKEKPLPKRAKKMPVVSRSKLNSEMQLAFKQLVSNIKFTKPK